MSDPIIYPSVLNCWPEEYETLPEELKKQYVYNEETHAYDVPDETWAKGWRMHGPYWADPTHPEYIPYTIGGSDIGVLFDGSDLSNVLELYEGQHGSRFKSVLDLWYEKAGIPLPMHDKVNQDVFDVGHIEEDSIRRLFLKAYKEDHPGEHVKVINDTHFYKCTDVEGVVCNVDGIIETYTDDPDKVARGIVECKTVRFNSEDFPIYKAGNVPLKYFLQCCTYMMCLNLNFSYLVVKMGVGEIMYRRIDRDPEIEEYLKKMITEFLESLRSGKEPNISGQDIGLISDFYRKKIGPYVPGNDKPVELSDSLLPVLKQIATINAEIKQFEAQVDEKKKERNKILVSEIFPLFPGNASYGRVRMSDKETLEIHLKNTSRKPPIDTERLAAEQPELYKRYVTTEVKETFNTKGFKKDYPQIADEYSSSGEELTETKKDYCEVVYKVYD